MKLLIAALALFVLGQHNPQAPNGGRADRQHVVAPQPFCTDGPLMSFSVNTSVASVRTSDNGNFCILKFYTSDLDGLHPSYNALKGLQRYSAQEMRDYLVANEADWDGEP